MPDLPLNVDRSAPVNTALVGIPVNSQHIKAKTYWLKGMVLSEDGITYQPATTVLSYATLHVPKVCRLIYTYRYDGEAEEEFCNVTADDCNGSIPVPGPDGCNPDLQSSFIGIGSCEAAPTGYGAIVGRESSGRDPFFCGMRYYTLPEGESPCGWTLKVYDYLGADYYEGPLGNYNPSPSDYTVRKVPGIYGYYCCNGEEPGPPLPPPPPPPVSPPEPPDCGDGGDE